MSRRRVPPALALLAAFVAWTIALAAGALAPLDAVRTPLGPGDPSLGWWLLVARAFAPGWVSLASVLTCLVVWRTRPLRALAVALGALVAYASERVLKLLFARPRPEWQLGPNPLTDFAYPSGHATAAGFALCLALASGRGGRRLAPAARWAVAAGVALVVADRWLLGVHYPSDLVAGLLLGATIARASLAAGRLDVFSRPRG